LEQVSWRSRPGRDRRVRQPCRQVFAALFRKRKTLGVLVFRLLYGLAATHLLELVEPFMRDRLASGSLGVMARDRGSAHGDVSITA
jgi:hypothetical protein